jgi:microsomal epoxide hydrolase
MTDSSIRPFTIEIPQSDLDDLRDRLGRTRWPDEAPEDAGWSYGVPLPYLRELAAYWADGYDWRAEEARLNGFPQFTTTIDGANIHFLHVRSSQPDAMPLVLTHGWPGSVAELAAVIGPLSETFHVVVPALPGFGFSGPTTELGWDVGRVARVWAELMTRLGYERFGAHGGDFGSAVSRELAVRFPERVIGLHVTDLFSSMVPAADEDYADDAERQAHRAALARYEYELSGYSTVQATRPQTLAYGLTDSPVGQLAWIVERFKDWTDSKDAPEDAVDRDAMLTNVMLYWLTGTANSSARIYKATAAAWGAEEQPSTVPTGVCVLPRNLTPIIRTVAERDNPIVHWTELARGGHFPGMEVPELLAADITAFFTSLG